MKVLIKLFLFCFVVSGSISRAGASQQMTDPLDLYGNKILFDVFREGNKVGFHKVEFRNENEALRVRSIFDLKISFLFLNAYFFAYRSEANWIDGALDQLEAVINDDGEEQKISVRRLDQMLHIASQEEEYTVRGPVFPTNHWNIKVTEEQRVLNTLTGRLNNVVISSRGTETVPTEHGTTQATRYQYSGDLETEVWYDDAGRWVKLRFEAHDGSVIDYVCRQCQGQ